jgi:hypothetical protein
MSGALPYAYSSSGGLPRVVSDGEASFEGWTTVEAFVKSSAEMAPASNAFLWNPAKGVKTSQ